MRFSSKRWFTLWEILVIVIVISVGILSIISLLTYGINFIQKSRQKVIAINLAREWIEAVYQIRDTNRQRRAGMKEECWLKIDPLEDERTPWCTDDTRMQSGFYILQPHTVSDQQYFLLTGFSSLGLADNALQYSLCFSHWSRISCPGLTGVSSEGRYFREIQWYGLWAKDSSVTWWTYLPCTNGEDTDCGTTSAKEFRFCSRVMYMWYGTGSVELCGVLTNFKAK